MRSSNVLVTTILLMLTGCATTLDTADLKKQYERSAQYHGPARNPIIVIPGILGSKLIEEDTERVVWGAFGGGALSPRNPEGAQAIALPMGEGKSLRDLRDNVISDGALDRIRVRFIGLPIELQAYSFILSALGAGGYRDELLGRVGAIDYGDDHFTCFQFDYDWRRDNVENAQRLYNFMYAKRAYVRAQIKQRYGVDNPDIKFDVVTHSMGGLLLRYMLRYGDMDLPEDGSTPEVTWAGAELVENAILIAPPNAGSAEAVSNLVEGVAFSPFLPKYEPALLGTYPSLYQLLPRARHGTVIDAETGNDLDIFEPAFWESNGWGLVAPEQERALRSLLPNAKDDAERRRIAREHLEKCLARARHLHAALDAPASPPEGLRLHLAAGDAIMTAAVHSVAPVSGELTISEEQPGDGTVLRSSALMDERVGGEWIPTLVSPIRWNNVTFVFKDHLGITNDQAFTDNLLYLLLESQR